MLKWIWNFLPWVFNKILNSLSKEDKKRIIQEFLDFLKEMFKKWYKYWKGKWKQKNEESEKKEHKEKTGNNSSKQKTNQWEEFTETVKNEKDEFNDTELIEQYAELEKSIMAIISTYPTLYQESKEENFTQKLTESLENKDFSEEIMKEVGKPKEDESKEEFVERCLEFAKKFLYKKFGLD